MLRASSQDQGRPVDIRHTSASPENTSCGQQKASFSLKATRIKASIVSPFVCSPVCRLARRPVRHLAHSPGSPFARSPVRPPTGSLVGPVHQLVSSSVHRSPVHLFARPPASSSARLPVRPSFRPPARPSACLPARRLVRPPARPFPRLSVCRPVCRPVRPFTHLAVCPFASPSTWLSTRSAAHTLVPPLSRACSALPPTLLPAAPVARARALVPPCTPVPPRAPVPPACFPPPATRQPAPPLTSACAT